MSIPTPFICEVQPPRADDMWGVLVIGHATRDCGISVQVRHHFDRVAKFRLFSYRLKE